MGGQGRGTVFITYRRADTAQAGWLFNRLTGHFGRNNVVMDVDPAPYGGNLAHAIDASVATCDALVVLIGQHWLAVTGEGLHDPNNYVRLALESALSRGTLVIPVTVDGARMPVNGELPPSLAGMAGRPAFEVGLRSFDADTGQLMRVLEQGIAERQATQLAGPGPYPAARIVGARYGPRPAAVRDQAADAEAAVRDPDPDPGRSRGRRGGGGGWWRSP